MSDRGSGMNIENGDKAVRLVDYLLRVAALRTKLIRDISKYEKTVWISDVPHERGCFTQAWGRDVGRVAYKTGRGWGWFTQAGGRDEEHEPDEWLEVQNRREPELPSIPARCEEWVKPETLRNKSDLPELSAEITRQITDTNGYQESVQLDFISPVHEKQEDLFPLTQDDESGSSYFLEDHPKVQQAWEDYVENKWLPWMEEHNSWEKVHEVYSTLFAIHQEQLRLGEEYELVLGLGLLTWLTPNGQRVRRHLLIADATLDFEAGQQRFTVRPHPEGTKLRPELDMLDPTEQPQGVEQRAKEGLVIPIDQIIPDTQSETTALEDPWEVFVIEGVLKAMAYSFSSEERSGESVHGEYFDALERQGFSPRPKPVVEYAPALILRKRSTKGLTETLKRIREQIENGEDIPGEFADLAEIRPKDSREPSDEPIETNAVFDGEIFFPKPSNDEQRRIVDKMRAANGVLVQGPPGTGKSHTIANLICHLLATGQRTLITAKTPRALQVLEGLVPDELRPLCINLLGSGQEERRSLESSVGGILRKNEEWNEERAERRRSELEASLRILREKKVEVNRRLRDIRESETHTHSIAEGTYRGTASRIAKSVNRDRVAYEWFTDTVPVHQECRVTEGHLQSLLGSLRYFTGEVREEMAFSWIDPRRLPSPDLFAHLVKSETEAIEKECGVKTGADTKVAEQLFNDDVESVMDIKETFSALIKERTEISHLPYAWIEEALKETVSPNKSSFGEILRRTEESISLVEDIVTLADDNVVEISEGVDIRNLHRDVRHLKKHLEKGGKLGWWLFRPRLVKERGYVLDDVRLNGHRCSTIEQFSLLYSVLSVRVAIDAAWRIWSGQCESSEGTYTLQLHYLREMCDALSRTLEFRDFVDRCRRMLTVYREIIEPDWLDNARMSSILSSALLSLAMREKREVEEEFQFIERHLAISCAKRLAHPLLTELLDALRQRDLKKYAYAKRRLDELESNRQRLVLLEEDMKRLDSFLPELLRKLKIDYENPVWDERLRHFPDAWHWAQARYWIEDYIRQEDVPALTKCAEQIEDEISSRIAELASLHAWSFCFSRLKENHRRHMEAWQQSMRRLGKGTGKHAPRHRREAQGHLNECREAVPAWVMPLHRVWDTVYPAPGMFDVIIVDEASQCGAEALPLFYLGKKVLIVGDDKQISPEAVGLPRDAVHRLMKEFLHDFHFKSSFDVESSLFDHGKLRYGTRRITLREHFRCMPEIIRFSNDLCYSDTPLIPLRQYGPDRLPPLERVFVSKGNRKGTRSKVINETEAEVIVERIIKMCSDSRYDGKTMGVVALQGKAQAPLIRDQLLKRLGAEEMERRRLVCGDPYSFQGDERDIMFLSMVAAPKNQDDKAADIATLTRDTFVRRFNVAASRARDQMILFHSVSSNDLSDSCLRKRLLSFFENTQPQQIAGIERDELERRAAQDNRDVVKPPPPFDSWFEIDVALELLRKDFTVLSQHEVAGKRIDLVVEGGQARLAIECDGDHWHGADRYEADMQRQRQLERCGWEFFRVRESTFYVDKEQALASLWPALEERGIFPARTRFQECEPYIERMPDCPPEPEEPFETDEANFQSEQEQNAKSDEWVPMVCVGSSVEYEDLSAGTQCRVQISTEESRPDWGLVNKDTAIAKALLGKEEGEEVVLYLPVGEKRLRIISITGSKVVERVATSDGTQRETMNEDAAPSPGSAPETKQDGTTGDLENCGTISFDFTANDSFLRGNQHPITIPKDIWRKALEKGFFNENDPVGKVRAANAIGPNGQRLQASIYTGKSGWGRYYQIRLPEREMPSDFLVGIHMDDVIKVRLTSDPSSPMTILLEKI